MKQNIAPASEKHEKRTRFYVRRKRQKKTPGWESNPNRDKTGRDGSRLEQEDGQEQARTVTCRLKEKSAGPHGRALANKLSQYNVAAACAIRAYVQRIRVFGGQPVHGD